MSVALCIVYLSPKNRRHLETKLQYILSSRGVNLVKVALKTVMLTASTAF